MGNEKSETSAASPLQKLVSCGAMVGIYLEQNGYGGLCSPGNECACDTSDLMPCGGDCAMDCEAGHKVVGCSDNCGQGCDFHIVAGRKQ